MHWPDRRIPAVESETQSQGWTHRPPRCPAETSSFCWPPKHMARLNARIEPTATPTTTPSAPVKEEHEMDTTNDQPLQTGRYDRCIIHGGPLGDLAVESEPGRSIVVSRGKAVSGPDASWDFQPKGQFLVDVRDTPRLIGALQWAHENASRPVTCPNGCDEHAGAACSECPS